VRVKFTRLDVHTQTIQFDYLGSYGNSSVKNVIVTGDSPGANQDSEVKVYNKTGDSTYEIYLQIDSATTITVEIYHKGSTIDEHYATLTTANSGAIDETGLTMVYNSGTYADFSLRDKNVIISDDTIYSGLYNYGDTQSIFIDRGVAGGTAGTVIADTTYTPPPGVVGDVVCKFTNLGGGEAVTNNFAPPGLTCSTGDVFTFGVWALATQTVGMEFFINPAGPGGAAVGWQVIGDGNWRFYQNSVTVISGASNATAFFRVDNNTGSSAVYLTGATIRKNPVAPANTLLPYTPRYSPISGKGTVLATRNLIAKEAAIKTLTGNVGIGLTNPLYPLDISGHASTGPPAGVWGYYVSTTELANVPAPYDGWNQNISLRASENIIAQKFQTYSDRRIKKNIIEIRDDEALIKLRKLKPCKYNYIDTVARGNGDVYGFIAQEVGSILPDAIGTHTGYIPNIYDLVNVSESNKITFNNYKTSNLEANSVIQVVTTDNKREQILVSEVIDEDNIRVEEDLSPWISDTGKLFVYGQEVDDFTHLDKNTIWTVATAALQEVDRQLQAEKEKVTTLETQLASVLTRLDALENA
jgi:hypothetical protein